MSELDSKNDKIFGMENVFRNNGEAETLFFMARSSVQLLRRDFHMMIVENVEHFSYQTILFGTQDFVFLMTENDWFVIYCKLVCCFIGVRSVKYLNSRN